MILTPQHIRKSTVVPTSNKPKDIPKKPGFRLGSGLPATVAGVLQSDLPRHYNFHKFQKEVHETEKC